MNLHADGSVSDLHALEVPELEGLEHVPGVGVDLDEILLKGGDLRDEVHAPLTLLLLELEGDVADRATLDALHEVGGEAGDLVAHTLGGDHSDLVTDALVGVEIEGEAGVVLLHDDAGGTLYGLGADSHIVSFFCYQIFKGRHSGKVGVRI